MIDGIDVNSEHVVSKSVFSTENDEKVSGTFDEIRTLKFQ